MHNKLAAMIGLTDTTINVVRRIASELRPSILDDLGLVEAIEWQTQQFQARTGIQCCCDFSLQSILPDDQQSTAVFRIVQEALTNILRHAQATRVSVAIRRRGGELVLDGDRQRPWNHRGRKGQPGVAGTVWECRSAPT